MGILPFAPSGPLHPSAHLPTGAISPRRFKELSAMVDLTQQHFRLSNGHDQDGFDGMLCRDCILWGTRWMGGSQDTGRRERIVGRRGMACDYGSTSEEQQYDRPLGEEVSSGKLKDQKRRLGLMNRYSEQVIMYTKDAMKAKSIVIFPYPPSPLFTPQPSLYPIVIRPLRRAPPPNHVDPNEYLSMAFHPILHRVRSSLLS